MAVFKYKAFISYSHKDKKAAKWLHKKLETYAFPKPLLDQPVTNGHVPKKLKPIFRDREDLSAGYNLGEKIETALKVSENLIVICSPNSAISQWVNQEILFFKHYHKNANIFSVIIDGEPFSQDPKIECFPGALRFEINEGGDLSQRPAEPIAADLRGTGDGRRLGLLKLISGIAGLDVNALVQRDLKRARKRVTAITASASAIVLMMGMLTWTAIDARQEAEKRRYDAEGQIEFMLTDLKHELERVGRLDALEAVGERSIKYYDNYAISDHDDDALGRRARVFHFLGDIQLKLGNDAPAETHFLRAYDATQALFDRAPNDPDRIFEHSQSAFWLGNLFFSRSDFKQAVPYFKTYQEFAEYLNQHEPSSSRALQEYAFAKLNYGIVLSKTSKPQQALEQLDEALPALRDLYLNSNQSYILLKEYGNALGWKADILRDLGRNESCVETRMIQISEYDKYRSDGINADLIYQKHSAEIGLCFCLMAQKKYAQAYAIATDGLAQISQIYSQDKKNTQWLRALIYFHNIIYEAHILGQIDQPLAFDLTDIIKLEDRLGNQHPTVLRLRKDRAARKLIP